ncbi:MAG: 2'-5' RNA ligase family protein [Blastocatellia bacterium]|nr:2'-5' RNA ligase family protein [Blastocatellia bacterium]
MQSHIQRYAIWLLPAQPDQHELQNRIQPLSQRFSSVPFPPHLTLFAGANQPLPTIQAAIEVACSDRTPFMLRSTGLQVSSAFFQTLFVEFAPHPGLSALAEQLRQELDPSSTRPFHPHLSLLYHEMSLPEKDALRTQIHWTARTIRFDEVSIVFPPRGEHGWEDITAWKTMDTHKLW